MPASDEHAPEPPAKQNWPSPGHPSSCKVLPIPYWGVGVGWPARRTGEADSPLYQRVP